MQLQQAIELIEKAVPTTQAGYWADLGCGNGIFTSALLTLLPQGGRITAIDQRVQKFSDPAIRFQQADFVRDELPLQNLNGILMANAFHYVEYKAALIRKLENYFITAPQFLLVEYDTEKANPWVPFPLSFQKLSAFFYDSSYDCVRTGRQPSAFGGMLYSALARKS